MINSIILLENSIKKLSNERKMYIVSKNGVLRSDEVR